LTKLIAGALALLASSALAAPLTVTVSNVASGDGSVVVWVFDSADNWLSDRWRTRKVVAASAREGDSIAVTIDLPPGDYGVLAFHDRNDDGKLARAFLGRFSEPAGAANGARSWIGAPDWSDAKFTIGAEPVALAIALE
jgi:uncharacterized protein (DUF2141 family)